MPWPTCSIYTLNIDPNIPFIGAFFLLPVGPAWSLPMHLDLVDWSRFMSWYTTLVKILWVLLTWLGSLHRWSWTESSHVLWGWHGITDHCLIGKTMSVIFVWINPPCWPFSDSKSAIRSSKGGPYNSKSGGRPNLYLMVELCSPMQIC